MIERILSKSEDETLLIAMLIDRDNEANTITCLTLTTFDIKLDSEIIAEEILQWFEKVELEKPWEERQ